MSLIKISKPGERRTRNRKKYGLPGMLENYINILLFTELNRCMAKWQIKH